MRTIKLDELVWTVEDDGEPVPQDRHERRRFRRLKFTSGQRVRLGQIASVASLAELSDETLELAFNLGDEVRRYA